MSERPEVEQPFDPTGGLNLRIFIQERYGARTVSWFSWVFERIRNLPAKRVLELGCGPGTLWAYNAAQIPPDWQVVLTDPDEKMVREARSGLHDVPRAFSYAAVEAGAIPLCDSSADLVIANGVLDIVPDLPASLAEARRILAPGGFLVAATGGSAHLRELEALVKPIEPSAQLGRASAQFSLENGADQLSPLFSVVAQDTYTDTLTFSEVTPILLYFQSESELAARLQGERLQALIARVTREIETHGSLRVSVEKALFVASRSS